jgi:outer membrane protein assembly factor BamA
MEAEGARIGQIRIVNNDVFDTNDAQENKMLFRWANALHIRTRPHVIESALLFKRGDLLSVRVLDETERLMRSARYLYGVRFRAEAYHDGVVDLAVETLDTWSLDPGFSASRAGGANSSGIALREYNLLGTGMSLGYGRSRNVDRVSNELQLSTERLLGSRAAFNYAHALNSDGQRDAVSLVRPFYALDARWAAGVSASQDDRIDSVYNAGTVVSQYRRQLTQAEVFGGSSAGLVDGWARRYSLGVSLRDSVYAPEPGLVAPAQLPQAEKLVAPFVRAEWVEDRFERQQNRNLIGRPEFFALGVAATVQLGWARTGWGSSHDALLYSAAVSRGFEPAPEHTLTTAASLSGQYASGQVSRQRFSAQARYYLPQSPRWLFYAATSADVLTRPELGDVLLLGGDSGLRGYPLRYQSGNQRSLFTLEERFYTDLYVWRLFRLGGAAFFDAGRAWGGDNVNTVQPGWLSDVGMGLRIVSARAAFSNVLHVDLAFPLDPTSNIKRVQILVKTKVSF